MKKEKAREWCFQPLKLFGYDVVMIDPPWPFDLWSCLGNKKSPAAHYKLMTLDEIAALPVGELMRAGGVCIMWCTWPLVAKGAHADMMRAWGIEPKTGGDWAKRTPSGKLRMGPGYIMRTVCEPFIVGTIGDEHGFKGKSFRNLIETSIDGIAREHSRKPEEMYRQIEKITPNAFRADVFARQRREGWDAWGNQLEKFKEVAA